MPSASGGQKIGGNEKTPLARSSPRSAARLDRRALSIPKRTPTQRPSMVMRMSAGMIIRTFHPIGTWKMTRNKRNDHHVVRKKRSDCATRCARRGSKTAIGI